MIDFSQSPPLPQLHSSSPPPFLDVSPLVAPAPIQLPHPSHKTFMIKKKLAKKMRQNRPIPNWIRMRTGTMPSADTGAEPSLDFEGWKKGKGKKALVSISLFCLCCVPPLRTVEESSEEGS
ncbi:hypothetical protein Ccrd_017428 [Cynara cardunculus var. scolymus]|uniref:Ribosomal protein L39e n=1 Tax=Cynara cardunculus var. scolymus TaxID=59895 RepID=A0A103Y848_CYNCS|nr:hypothetical protein Ccrd_017428 [Cynara cardunculus var. scolymus]